MAEASPNWARFGLATPAPTEGAVPPDEGETEGSATSSTAATESTRLRNPLLEEGFYGEQEEELFSEEKGQKPWWMTRQFFVRERLLFGRWDGVFTSCLVNLLGVIVFLRAGWVVGEAGVVMATVIVLVAVLVVLTSVLSAVGIRERSASGGMEGGSGGVYSLLAHVLGGRTGGAVGLVYCFGQTVSITLCVAGFGESLPDLLSVSVSPWVERGIAAVALLLLALLNVAGVKWVVRVQSLLLLCVLLAVGDFLLGALLPPAVGSPGQGWSLPTLRNNTSPSYTAGHSWFTVAGVFFPSVTGIMAGINMSGDLRSPATDIPVGTLAALGVSTAVYLMVMIVLAATVSREVLLTDFMITEKVSAIGALLVAGLYTSSLSSSVASLYGTPRVLQSIAAENVVPFIGGLAKGRGPNQVPVAGLVVVVVAAGACLLLGSINTLAPIVSTPFLLTYATIDYAYFALAVTADAKANRDGRYWTYRGGGGLAPHSSGAQSRSTLGVMAGSVLDRLFPERVTHHKKIITSTASSDSSSLATTPDDPGAGPTDDCAIATPTTAPSSGIAAKSQSWHSGLCNRWVALVGAILKVSLMVAINWVYGLATLAIALLLHLYIGRAAPGLPPGLAGDFSLFRWIKFNCLRCLGRAPLEPGLLVVAPVHPGVVVEASQLTEDNKDFAARSRYHASSAGNTMHAPPLE